MSEAFPWVSSLIFLMKWIKSGLRSVKRNAGESFSQTNLHLLNYYSKSVSCDLQLESSRYSRGRDLMLDRINYINNR